MTRAVVWSDDEEHRVAEAHTGPDEAARLAATAVRRGWSVEVTFDEDDATWSLLARHGTTYVQAWWVLKRNRWVATDAEAVHAVRERIGAL